MSRGQTDLARAELVRGLNDEVGRKSSTATILYQLAIADRLGVGLTDLVCGEILSRTGAITAGELAELSGLTTGAITGVVDRLERAGLVRRVNDPNDRRRVMLEPIAERFNTLSGNPYDALEKRFNALYANYSDGELALLSEFLRQSIAIFDEEAVRLRQREPSPHKPPMEANLRARMAAQADLHADMHARANAAALIQIRRGGHSAARVFSAPRGNLTAARLEWLAGSGRLNLRGAPGMTELYRAEFKHDIPIVRDQDGNLSVQYRHRTLFGRGGGDADVILNPETTWDMHIECGASHIEADLRALALRGLMLQSKATRLNLWLPPPNGTVVIRLESGLSHIHIVRPKQAPVRLEFEGEYSAVRFDRSRMNASNETRESPEYKRATNRYRIEFIGGGSKLTIEENKG